MTLRTFTDAAGRFEATLDIPSEWDTSDVPVGGQLLAAYDDGGSLAEGYSTNVVLTATEVPVDLTDQLRQHMPGVFSEDELTTLPAWQIFTRLVQLRAVPGVTVQADEPYTEGVIDGYHTAAQITGPNGEEVLCESWSQYVAGVVVTATTTTVGSRSDRAKKVLPAIGRSLQVTAL